jgi:hypothetical protein
MSGMNGQRGEGISLRLIGLREGGEFRGIFGYNAPGGFFSKISPRRPS